MESLDALDLRQRYERARSRSFMASVTFPGPRDHYLPIEEHGMVGNMHTCALVGTDATIDWYCYPHFDSPSMFGAILDAKQGGYYRVSPAAAGPDAISYVGITYQQFYHPDTNVLLTRFLSDTGVGQVRDFMPVIDTPSGGSDKADGSSKTKLRQLIKARRDRQRNGGGGPDGKNSASSSGTTQSNSSSTAADEDSGHGWLIRQLEVVRGTMWFQVECIPAFDYATTPHMVRLLPNGAIFVTPDLCMVLTSSSDRNWRLMPHHNSGVMMQVCLSDGEKEALVLREYQPAGPSGRLPASLSLPWGPMPVSPARRAPLTFDITRPHVTGGIGAANPFASATGGVTLDVERPQPQLILAGLTSPLPPVMRAHTWAGDSQTADGAAPSPGAAAVTASSMLPPLHPQSAGTISTTPMEARFSFSAERRDSLELAQRQTAAAAAAHSEAEPTGVTTIPIGSGTPLAAPATAHHGVHHVPHSASVQQLPYTAGPNTLGVGSSWHTSHPYHPLHQHGQDVDFTVPFVTLQQVDALHDRTMRYWWRWLSQCTYKGRWREHVYRSALALKLMTYAPTGALVAAPTTSLPEDIGGVRNWDYRFAWIRDSSFMLGALLRLGFKAETEGFLQWVEARCESAVLDADDPNGGLQIMYGLRGETKLYEFLLPHLDGYRSSKPVRIGNGAFSQTQLDIYGDLMDMVWSAHQAGVTIKPSLWKHLTVLIDWVCNHWHLPDEGIWEVRGGKQNFTQSKVMTWVAVDRAIKLVEAAGHTEQFSKADPASRDEARAENTVPVPVDDVIHRSASTDRGADGTRPVTDGSHTPSSSGGSTARRSLSVEPQRLARWRQVRHDIFANIQEHGWNGELRSFTQSYNSNFLDAACLYLPLVAFLPASDDRIMGTLGAILRRHVEGGLMTDNLVYRYNPHTTKDGCAGDEGTFSICTLWAVHALALSAPFNSVNLDKARAVFEQTLAYGNHLHLFSEEIGRRGEALGNFPQGFTHLALVHAAVELDHAIDRQWEQWRTVSRKAH